MRRVSLEEVKKIELEILKYVNRVCQENNIRYSLFAGTLLGAVRHNGFIPWDDDIDICLPIEDYKRLIGILKNENKYLLKYDLFETSYTYCHAKLVDPNTIVYESEGPNNMDLGIWIDIFPVVGIPNQMSEKEYIKRCDSLNKTVYYSISTNYLYDKKVIRKIAKAVFNFPYALYSKIRGTKYWKNKRLRLYEMQEFNQAINVGVVPTIYGEKTIWPREMFESYTSIKFEDEEFQVVSEWDSCLTKCYGNYMELPPMDKRVPGHFKAYYRE